MRLVLNTLLRLAAATYFLLTSIYCLLAFLPYTYFFLIKAPPYAWMPWFVCHQAVLYFVAVAATVAANWPVREAFTKRDRSFLVGAVLLLCAGFYLTIRPFLPGLQANEVSYAWSLVSLFILIALAIWRPSGRKPAEQNPGNSQFRYVEGVWIATTLCLIYALGSKLRIYSETRTLAVHWADAEFTLWSLVSHLMLAIAIVSVLNLVSLLAAKTQSPRAFRRTGNSGIVFLSLWTALSRFLANGLSFAGWHALIYSATLALALTLWGFRVVQPFLGGTHPDTSSRRWLSSTFAWVGLAASAALACGFPYVIGGADWSGFLEGVITLVVWIAVSACLFRLRPVRVQYSALAVLLVLAGSAASYKALQASEIFWSRPLGATDDEISMALETYGGHDASFLLAHHILGNGKSERCGDLCRILREYTNIRNPRARADVQLVDSLSPSVSAKPNIFVFVIDSMRPDYLGSYNPAVDYTPNLDAFARDSIVLHNVYSQYAGTSLSEPAIWSGAMMLHAHYPQPFSRLNSLDRMLHKDDYRMLVSIDEVLSELLPADDAVVRLDTDKKLWNQLELCSTVQEAETAIDTARNPGQPVFLYSQPKNVHQFARNDVPSPTSQHWPDRRGLNTRITYEVHWVDSCLGKFFGYLKQRGLYDDSIIIVTSDHGDATGELGRISHSTLIWPEIMRVPLIVHLPPKMRKHLVYDDNRVSTLTDLTPTLYYLLGHRPIRQNPLYGRPLFAETQQELDSYPKRDLLLASDVRAVYGILTADGRYLYTTYDSPAESYLFDLAADPNAQHNLLTAPLKQHYDEEIIEHLHMIGDFYGYKPGVESLLASTAH